jgi:two-component system cell cycle sensor histidine kinase/response regulator CckA
MNSEVPFGLEGAIWPALLVDAAGVIRRANRAAGEAFGPGVESGSLPLANLWLAENGLSPEQFFMRSQQFRSTLSRLELMGEGGAMISHQASVCPVNHGGENFFLLQLLPDLAPAAPGLPAGPAPVAVSPVATNPAPAANPPLEAGLAHKQKLDCALQLARTVALDFNNALTSILGHTSLVLSKMEPGSPWRPSLMEVEKSAAKAAEIANDLANFSRQEKETRGQVPGNVNLLLQRNVQALQSAKLDKEVEWSLQLERRIYGAKFDEAKMQQALLKILENAVEALGQRGRIIIQTKNIELTQPTQDRNARLAAGAYVCVEITDNGGGIEAEVLPRIFEPFFTTKRGGKHRGLGLAWVYGVVTNHGGGVAVSSQPGAGASVRVYLPADKKFVKTEGLPTDDLNGTQTVLMVDDEDLVLTMGQTVLEAYGYRVLTANSGQKALDLLAQTDTPVDLLITDLVMPAMSGRELVEQVHRVSPETRIICSSGYVRPTAQEEEDASYLQKPFTSQELLLKVKQTLAGGDAMPVD